MTALDTGRKEKKNNLTTTELAKYSFAHLGEFDLGVTDWFREAHDDGSGLLTVTATAERQTKK